MGPAHFGIALAARPIAPKAPLWVLLIAGNMLDFLCFAFMAVGIENMGVNQADFSHGIRILTPPSLTWSHGLFMSLIWSVLAAVLAYLIFRDKRTSAILGSVIFSHWLLDFIVHPPYLPLFLSGSPAVGLGLWGSGPGLIFSAVLDLGLLIGGIIVYRTWRRRK